MIQQQIIDGRKATVAYLTSSFEPTDEDSASLVKVIFDDGNVHFLSAPPREDTDGQKEAHGFNRHRQQHRRPLPTEYVEGDEEAGAWGKHRAAHSAPYVLIIEVPEDILPEDGPTNIADIPVKLQLVAWAKAIMVLDASEIMVRDLIERDLAGHTGQPVNVLHGMKAIPIVNRLVDKIEIIRRDAIKTAFRLLRSRLGDVKVLDRSLAVWAQAFAKNDLETIRTAITTSLIDGLDNTEIARKVVGTMGLNGVDGVTEFTRHKIAHLGRASIKAYNLRKAGILIPS